MFEIMPHAPRSGTAANVAFFTLSDVIRYQHLCIGVIAAPIARADWITQRVRATDSAIDIPGKFVYVERDMHGLTPRPPVLGFLA